MSALRLAVSAFAVVLSASTFADSSDTDWERWDRWRSVYEHQSRSILTRDFEATVVSNQPGRVTIRNDEGVRLVIVNEKLPVGYQGTEGGVGSLQRGDRVRVSFGGKTSVQRIEVLKRGRR